MKFGLIGKNVSYSKSPDVFKAIFKVDRRDGSFEIFHAENDELHSKLNELVAIGLTAFSVTIPHKKAILEVLDEVDTVARTLDAVNSVVVDGKKLRGFNTDMYGFSLPLRKYAERLKHGTALILGCGGSARAVAYSLYADYEIKEIVVVGRSQDKLDCFEQALKKHLTSLKIRTIVKDQFRHQRNNRYAITVNCTPAGGWNKPNETPLPSRFNWEHTALYYDLNYNPDNILIQNAMNAKLIVIDGSQMLTGQAIQSYFIWTGRTVPFEPVYSDAFRDHLEARN